MYTRINVSIDVMLCERINKFCKDNQLNRSAKTAALWERYIKEQEQKQTDENK